VNRFKNLFTFTPYNIIIVLLIIEIVIHIVEVIIDIGQIL